MGWRLTFVTLITVFALVNGRPSLLGSSRDEGHHANSRQLSRYGGHRSNSGQHSRNSGQHSRNGGHHGNSRQQATNGVSVVSAEPVLLNPDGSYSYRYQLSDGTFSFANGLADGEITGGFGYKDTEGKDIKVDFIAGKVGFVPSGAHLSGGIGGGSQSFSSDYDYNGLASSDDYNAEPYVHQEIAAESYVHQEIAAEPYVHEEESYSHNEIEAEPYVHEEESYSHNEIEAEPYVHQEEAYVHNEVAAEPYVHEDVAAEEYSSGGDENADKSFSFQFDGEEYNREEAADSQGTVQGRYGFIDADGVERNVNYKAGANIGFVPEADFFPVNPEADSAFSSFGKKTSSNLDGHSIQLPSSSSGANPNYYFEYKSDDASRVEDGMDGVVKGSYAYKTAGGNDINVRYSAGSQTGFVIENTGELAAAVENAASEPVPLNAKPYSGETVKVDFVGPKVDEETWKQFKSFRFGFDASDHSRNEESDDNGNVRGSYNYRSENGDDIEVRYTAGAGTGFVVENLDEVLAKASPQSNPIGSASNSIGVQSRPFKNNVNSPSRETPTGLYNAPAISQQDDIYSAPSNSLPSYNVPEATASASERGSVSVMNPNYKFAYANDDSSRNEDANPDTGVITGQYSYTNLEGNQIEVKYRAGADIGFTIENQDDLNSVVLKATEDGAAAAAKASSSVSTSYADPLPVSGSSSDFFPSQFPQPDTSFAASSSQLDTLYAAPSNSLPSSQLDTLYEAPINSLPSYNDLEASASSPAGTASGMVMDASFKFAVEEDDHSFQEEADVNGERIGSYSYTNPDGEEIQVRYTAGARGFVILNPEDVLPVAPVHNV